MAWRVVLTDAGGVLQRQAEPLWSLKSLMSRACEPLRSLKSLMRRDCGLCHTPLTHVPAPDYPLRADMGLEGVRQVAGLSEAVPPWGFPSAILLQ